MQCFSYVHQHFTLIPGLAKLGNNDCKLFIIDIGKYSVLPLFLNYDQYTHIQCIRS